MFEEISVVDEIIVAVQRSRSKGSDYLREMQNQLSTRESEINIDDLRFLEKVFTNDKRIVNIIIKSKKADSSLVLDLLAKHRYDLTLCETAVCNHTDGEFDEFIVNLAEKTHSISSKHTKILLRLADRKLSKPAKTQISIRTKHDPTYASVL